MADAAPRAGRRRSAARPAPLGAGVSAGVGAGVAERAGAGRVAQRDVIRVPGRRAVSRSPREISGGVKHSAVRHPDDRHVDPAVFDVVRSELIQDLCVE
ncbi:protein of unknown function [Burkholderia multivorans]